MASSNVEMETFHNPTDKPITFQLGSTPGAAAQEETVPPGGYVRGPAGYRNFYLRQGLVAAPGHKGPEQNARSGGPEGNQGQQGGQRSVGHGMSPELFPNAVGQLAGPHQGEKPWSKQDAKGEDAAVTGSAPHDGRYGEFAENPPGGQGTPVGSSLAHGQVNAQHDQIRRPAHHGDPTVSGDPRMDGPERGDHRKDITDDPHKTADPHNASLEQDQWFEERSRADRAAQMAADQANADRIAAMGGQKTDPAVVQQLGQAIAQAASSVLADQDKGKAPAPPATDTKAAEQNAQERAEMDVKEAASKDKPIDPKAGGKGTKR